MINRKLSHHPLFSIARKVAKLLAFGVLAILILIACACIALGDN
jgi:hypothetical protein